MAESFTSGPGGGVQGPGNNDDVKAQAKKLKSEQVKREIDIVRQERRMVEGQMYAAKDPATRKKYELKAQQYDLRLKLLMKQVY